MSKILVVDDSLVERVLAEGLLVKNPAYAVDLAEDGESALARIETCRPQLIVTDLLMPGMDGLELLKTVRRRYPEIPVILMTACGSDAIAHEALEAGAASYVPKARQAECLLPTVERVLEHATADRSRRRLAQCTLEFHCRYALPNDARLIRGLVDQIQEVMAGMEFGDSVERIRMGEALEEALLNAMYHGNLEIDKDQLAKVRSQLDARVLDRLVQERCRDPNIAGRTILVIVHLTQQEARFVIRDQGRGFNVGFVDAGEGADHFEGGRHRGLTLMRSLMDDVAFNTAGNEITLRKSTGSKSKSVT